MSISSVARGGLFLFVGSVTVSTLGAVYWVLISIFSGPSGPAVVGTANSVFSLGVLGSGIAVLGVPVGVQRFLGREFGRNDAKRFNTYFWTSFTFTLILCLLSAIMIWVIAFLNIPFIGFSENMLFLSGIIAFLGFSTIMSALFTSIIRTEYSAVSSAISSVARLSLGVLLVYLGFGWLGAVMGIILSSLSLLALMLFFTSRELKRLGGTKIHLSLKALRESLRAGFVSWLPAAVALIGQQLSLLTVYGIEGGYETGIFFIAYAMFSIVYMLPNSFMLVLFPVLSGLEDERATLAYRALKFCLALASPSAVFLVLYSRFPLSLMPGGAYIPAAPTLTFLALSIVPLVLTSAVSNLVYASGSYGKALGIGLAINIPKVALCLELLPIYGQFGAALAFLAGSFVGLGAAICVSKMVGFHVPLGKIALAIIVPSAAGLPCFLLGLDWLIGGIIILLASLICYGRLGVVDRRDLAEIARGFASEKTVAKARARFSWLLRIMYGE